MKNMVRENFERFIDDYEVVPTNWYQLAHNDCYELAVFFDVDIRLVCGIVAVTSPLVFWMTNGGNYPNLDVAIAVIYGFQCGHDPESIVNHGSGFKRNKYKALMMLETGKVFPHLSGDKVTAFYDNLLHPGTSKMVTIDMHMYRVAFDRLELKLGNNSPLRRYFNYAKIVREVLISLADDLGIPPLNLQSGIWEKVKNV